ncbi:Crp/Fnr family transcriptional regulator [Altererythrobacter sp. ZODW24]|uniref:Crp/Fnr family transcriptional regulator n=1 Tax=Altererythrobacter sp. ZODW24 TaxID=2185142 RepID=UPI000DF82133|nr:Crp/Fnr family transcriptional regulator [Altererythrobacter sp. ZODW24]
MLSFKSRPSNSYDLTCEAKAGKLLFLDGDLCDHVFELRHGIVRGVCLTQEGERQIAAFFFAGDQIGLPVSERYRFSAEAVTDLQYVRHSATRWQEDLMSACREQGRLLPSICAEQDPIFRRGMIVGRNSVLVRICAFLISVVDRLEEQDGVLAFPLTQIDLADYLAITPETTCRGFRHLRELGVISMPRRNHLIVRDRGKLATIASGAQLL